MSYFTLATFCRGRLQISAGILGYSLTQFLAGSADELEAVKLMLGRLPTRAYFCRTVLLATASV